MCSHRITKNPRPVAQLAISWLGEDSWQPSSRAGSRIRAANRSADIPKRDAVVEAFKVGSSSITGDFVHILAVCMESLWFGFCHLVYVCASDSTLERDAMGSDEYHPISRNGSNLTDAGGIGYTVIDSIDTMLIMGLNDDYARARTWVADKLSFETNGSFNTFEVNCFHHATCCA